MGHGATRRNEQYVKVERHAGELMSEKMNELGLSVNDVAEKSGLDSNIILGLSVCNIYIKPSWSDKIGPVLGIGKQALYKAHMRYMESGGN